MSKYKYRTYSRSDFIAQIGKNNKRINELRVALLNLRQAVAVLDFSYAKAQGENETEYLEKAMVAAKKAAP